MKCTELLKFLGFKKELDIPINNIVTNSKKVQKNDVFLAYRGYQDNGNKYIDEAITNGAVLIISDDITTPYLFYRNLKKEVFRIMAFFYNLDLSKLKIIGITGTNGKSSLAYYLHQSLTYCGYSSFLITTVPCIKDSSLSSLTTIEAIDLARIIKSLKNRYEYLIFEVSSIAYDQKRVEGIPFSYLFLTNLTSDHLDYHQSLKKYQQAKIDFINKTPAKIKFINQNVFHQHRDKFYATDILLVNSKALKNTEYTLFGSKFSLNKNHYQTGVLFKFNLELVQFVITFLYTLDLPPIRVKKAISALKPLKGRVDICSIRPLVIIDYAHTPEAFHLILSETKKHTEGRLICVFGSGGNRDQSKRKIYGEYARQYADLAIVTNDNPRDEDEDFIISQIVGSHSDSFLVIKDRFKAIEKAIKESKKDDTILILGKGHETTYQKQGRHIIYSDYEVVDQCRYML